MEENQKCSGEKAEKLKTEKLKFSAFRRLGLCLFLVFQFFSFSAFLRAQPNGLYREIYTEITGSTLLSFTNSSFFPDSPTIRELATNLFENPSNYGDNYGDRYRGLLMPPVTGWYVFWVQGQNAAQLFLSPDESPANKVSIGYNLSSALFRAWYAFPTQQSTNIYLEAGKRYYLEAWHKTGNGDDSFAVGWKLPDGTYEQPMPASRFRPYGSNAVSKPFILSQPSSLTVVEQQPATFRVGISNLDAVTYQWQRNNTNLIGQKGASLSISPATLSDHAATFRCVISNSFGAVTSGVVTLSVNPDTTAPTLFDAANLSSNVIQVIFSEPVDPVTATSAANYSLNNGAVISSATLGASSRTILLTTPGLQRNTDYTLTVNNVRDRAQNMLPVNSQKTFTALLKGIYREIYANIPGSLVSELTSAAAFPNAPLSVELITNSFETLAYPTNNYGQRLRALIIPPLTGDYLFSISAHDTATLSLGNSASPASAQVIASVENYSDAAARQFEVQYEQTSGLVSLVAGQPYYIEVLMKSGISSQFPPDHLSVRWQMPNLEFEEPISIARLTPIGLNLPTITQQPYSENIMEGSPVTFIVEVSNLDPVLYQWRRNGINIFGATNSTYSISSVLLSDHGASYQCVLLNAQGQTNSTPAILSVYPDNQPPTIASVVNNSSNRIIVTFSEPVDPITATTLANYSVTTASGATPVLSAPTLSSNGLSVTLTTTPLGYGSNYTITINAVRDRAATFNTIAANSQFTFTAVEFFLQDVGLPLSATASYTPVSGGFNMSAGNGDISGTNDTFNFVYQQRRGDFDVKVRVAKLDFADTWTMASLIVRSNLSPATTYAAVCATPSIAGVFFQYRTNTATTPQGSGSFPVNYPYTWLRLERTGGTTFNGYASIDGETWTKLGTATIGMTPTVYLGFMVSSHSDATTVNAEFRDFQDNTSLALGLPPTANEPLGPSSRRTGLAITELMYNPAPRVDNRHIEFIELHNSNPYFQDISGYRLSGDVSYTFPAGTIIPGGGFLVIGRSPADVIAVYGIQNVTGPYTNNLSNKSGTVRLRNPADAILLEVNYDSETPWPLAADGTGHSLVLAKPSLGEDHAEAWAQSDRIGGSPGIVDGVLVEPVRNVVINEYLAHTDLPDLDFIELYNRSTVPVDLSGCWLSDSPTTNKFRIPDGTIIGPTGFVYFTEANLGFSLSADGEAIYFVNSNLTRVIDAVGFDGQENGISTGRSPDGNPVFHRLATKTPGVQNGARRIESIVINEIMYNPISRDESDEYVELYNRGPNAVNLGGWRLNKAIDFTFPPNTIISSNGYIVVGKNVARLRSKYSNLNLTNALGDYDGSLANSGERLTLDMPDTTFSTNGFGVVQTNFIHIIVDEVTYSTGGQWGQWSDGGGSSLELIDPASDNRLPSNWADSDDTAKSQWSTITASGTLDNAAGSSSMWNALQFWLLEAGECLVDNLNVTIPGTLPAGNIVGNNGFESGGLGTGPTAWMLQGNHRYSFVQSGGDGGGNALHVVAQDRGDTGANRINKPLLAQYTTNGAPVGTITARVKWLHGRPEILFRLRGNMLEVPGIMNVPTNLGTPAARNSRYATNAGPAITEVAHSPVLPVPNQPIVVTARVHDPDGIASVILSWRVDPYGLSNGVAMLDNGTGSDAIARDGIYTAVIPGLSGQPDDDLVAFFLTARDSNSLARTTKFPNDAPARECLARVGDTQPVASFASYRFWMTKSTLDDWTVADKISSEFFKGTFIYGNYRIIYNAGSHYAGSPAHSKLYDSPVGTNCDYQLQLPADNALLNETSLRIQEPGLFGADRTCQNESTGYWLVGQMGLPALNRRPITMFVNGRRRGLIYEDTQRQNAGFLEQWYPDADADLSDLYRIGYWYEFGDDPLAQRSNNEPTLMPLLTTGGVKKLARYRQTFGKRAVKASAHDYTNLFELVDLLKTTSTGDAYASEVFPHLDVTSFARAFAAERILNNTDLYGARRIEGTESKAGSQNSFLARPGGDKWKFLIWDIDAAYLGTPVDPLFDFTDPPISNLFLHPYVMRTYWQALEDGVNGPLVPSKLHSVIDAKYAAFQAVGIGASSPQQMKDFLGIRRDYILQLLSETTSPFSITVNGGNNFTNGSTLVTLTGTAPFGARIITINGIAYPLSWSSITNWSARVPLTGQTNQFIVRGYDSKSNLLANSVKVITVYFAGNVAKPENSLVISEIMYQPKVTNAHFVEIYNRSTNTTFGLGGYKLNGVDFNFPAAQIISPLSRLVVVKDIQAFRSAYGTNAEIAGEYNGDLDKDGETLTLAKAAPTTNLADTVISKVKYEIVTPWPSGPAATNSGVSLQLIDPAQDVARVSNWGESSGWKFFSHTTNQISGARLSFWLNIAGTLYIDDIRFVHGSVPAVGSNFVRNGDFETNLTSAWTFGNSYQGGSALSSLYAKTGTNSLRLAPTISGSSSTAMYQDIVPTPSSSSSSNYTVSFWYRPTSNMTLNVRMGGSSAQPSFSTLSVPATPGSNNSIAGTVNPYPLLWINEIQPNNKSTLLDNTGTNSPWIELYNSSSNQIDIGGYSLSKSYTNLSAWTFPPGTVINPGQFRVIFVDGRPQFTTNPVIHTSFRLDGTNGSIILSRTNQILDYINYTNLHDNEAYGDVPDGQLFTRQLLYYPTPGASNNPSPAPIVINEWLASNTGTLTDPLTGTYEDWFELYNFSDSPVNLAGYYLTDEPNGNKNKWRIPDHPLSTIAPHSFLMVWADNVTITNFAGNALHTNFKLSKSGDDIGLFSPNLVKVDVVTFGGQANNVSQGRYPDGNVIGGFFTMSVTPRTNNVISGNAYAPVLAQPINRTVNEGALVFFNATATDADLPAQPLSYYLVSAPEGANITPGGLFTWQTSEIHGPGVYQPITIGVTDNGNPPRTDSKTFQITVNEINRAPTIDSIPNQTTYTGTLISVSLPVTDLDLPAQTFTYSVVSGPAGAGVDSAGTFTWTPSPLYESTATPIVVSATDSGTPPLSATQSFTIVVNGGSACAGYKGDVSPLGNPNGTNTIIDWVQVGLFAAGLADIVYPSCEFTRADCAPRPCGGGTNITTTDWVQAGRYAAGLDPLVSLYDCLPPENLASGKTKSRGKSATTRAVILTNSVIPRGVTSWIPVTLDAQGDETALGFSFRFETNLLTFIDARLTTGLENSTLLVNTSQAPQGVVGILISKPLNTSFTTGSIAFVELAFRGAMGHQTETTPLLFHAAPIEPEISNTEAQPLEAEYRDGTVTLLSDSTIFFTAIHRQTNGVNLQMTGPVGAWEIQWSLNLSTWQPLQTITNATGQLDFTDTTASNAVQRFYRAVKQ
jgi:hypothetical protein